MIIRYLDPYGFSPRPRQLHLLILLGVYPKRFTIGLNSVTGPLEPAIRSRTAIILQARRASSEYQGSSGVLIVGKNANLRVVH